MVNIGIYGPPPGHNLTRGVQDTRPSIRRTIYRDDADTIFLLILRCGSDEGYVVTSPGEGLTLFSEDTCIGRLVNGGEVNNCGHTTRRVGAGGRLKTLVKKNQFGSRPKWTGGKRREKGNRP